ncbi:BURP domain protein RD22-like [Dioscorea cayenensis subsp. rotundata]|uniref:BURP domain protein RD22-like n=1 Tax=Dioscorea cayennensis subsp. rotundata TaxID=55577 RepID=A0AB40BIT3_DIOCR|nr:BURP domain protein RD22-like [Dioscorea cayenensis subsp. rotundata]
MEGESKFCATSLESMVEFNMMSLETRDVHASSTKVNEKNNDAEIKPSYSVSLTGVCVMGGEKLVVCHTQQYPYIVFYCHATRKRKVYTVALEWNDGTKLEVIAVCHLDTSK